MTLNFQNHDKKTWPLSLVIITKNEERNIQRCIESVPLAAEVIVLDSQSGDATREIAERLGAQVFDEPFRGFRDQKQRASDLARQEWVLNLDADESLSPEAGEELARLFEIGPQRSAYSFPRRSFHMGRWILHGGWYPDRQIRLYRKSVCRWSEGHVHEKIESPDLGLLKEPLLHWVFRDLSHQIDTNNRYSSLGARDLMEKGKTFSLLKLLFKPISKFIETYLLKRGFLDGLPGFVISVGAAYSMFLKHAKHWELSHLKSREPKQEFSRKE